MISSGLRAWKVGAVSGGNYDIVENVNINGTVFRVNAVDGSVLLRGRTSTQLSTLAPSATGEMLLNSTVNAICVSTGIGAGAWVTPISTASATNMNGGTRPQCY